MTMDRANTEDSNAQGKEEDFLSFPAHTNIQKSINTTQKCVCKCEVSGKLTTPTGNTLGSRVSAIEKNSWQAAARRTTSGCPAQMHSRYTEATLGRSLAGCSSWNHLRAAHTAESGVWGEGGGHG